jgi:hypothetical protein
MSAVKGNSFSEKHQPDVKPDPVIEAKIRDLAKNEEVPCALAFKVVKETGVAPLEVGKTIDLINYRIVKCQLGLFGYKSGNRIIKPVRPDNTQIEDAIQNRLVKGRLPCKTAWEIAELFDTHKMTISKACEAMGIKISSCQLGAF